MAFPTTGVLDNFNRADSASLGASWAVFVSGDGRWGILSNEADGIAGWYGDAWGTALSGPDQEAHAKIANKGSTTAPSRVSLWVRVQETGTTTPDGYGVQFYNDAGTDVWEITRLDNNVGTTLGATFTQEVTNGDSFGLSVVGSTIRAYHKPAAGSWTELASRTDTTYTAGRTIAIEGNQTDWRLDDFGGGDVVLTGSFSPASNSVLLPRYQEFRRFGEDEWWFAQAAAGQTIAIGQALETDTAQAITVNPQRRLIGQVVETDTAQAIDVEPLRRLVGQTSETDSSQAVSAKKTAAIGQVSETDTAQAVSVNPQRRLVGQVTETDVVQALSARKSGAVAQVSETDVAQVVSVNPQRRLVGQASESDLAQPITAGAHIVAVGQALETDSAQAISALKRLAVGQATEADTAQAFAELKAKAIAQATETDTSQPFTIVRLRELVQALEADQAQGISHLKVKALERAAETDAAQTIAIVGGILPPVLISVHADVGIFSRTSMIVELVERYRTEFGIDQRTAIEIALIVLTYADVTVQNKSDLLAEYALLSS